MRKGATASAAKFSALEHKIILCAACVPPASAPKLTSQQRYQWKLALERVVGITDVHLASLIDAAKANKTLAAREVMRVSLLACATWFDRAASAGFGAIHRAAKPHVYVASEAVIVRDGSLSVTKNQAEYMCEKRQVWATKWNHDGQHDPELLRLLSAFRSEAVEVPRDPLSVLDLDSALQGESDSKARGLVQVSPSDLTR